MSCPRCGDLLDERERDGVTIDTCPSCRGIWLDRGELERLLARFDPGERPRARRADDRDEGRRRDAFEGGPERARRRDDDDDDDDRRGGFFGALRNLFD